MLEHSEIDDRTTGSTSTVAPSFSNAAITSVTTHSRTSLQAVR